MGCHPRFLLTGHLHSLPLLFNLAMAFRFWYWNSVLLPGIFSSYITDSLVKLPRKLWKLSFIFFQALFPALQISSWVNSLLFRSKIIAGHNESWAYFCHQFFNCISLFIAFIASLNFLSSLSWYHGRCCARLRVGA